MQGGEEADYRWARYYWEHARGLIWGFARHPPERPQGNRNLIWRKTPSPKIKTYSNTNCWNSYEHCDHERTQK